MDTLVRNKKKKNNVVEQKIGRESNGNVAEQQNRIRLEILQ